MKWKRWSIGCVATLLLLIVSTCFWKTIFYLILSTFGGVTTYRQIGTTEVSWGTVTQHCNVYIAARKYPCLAIGPYRFYDVTSEDFEPTTLDFLLVSRKMVFIRIQDGKSDRGVMLPWRLYLMFDFYGEVPHAICFPYENVKVVHDPGKKLYHYIISPDPNTGPRREMKFSIREKDWLALPSDPCE